MLSILGGSRLVSGNPLSKSTENNNTPSNALSRMSGDFPCPAPKSSGKRDKDSVGWYHDIDAPSHANVTLSLTDPRFTLFTFTVGLLIGNDESKMELKKRVATPTLSFEPLLNIVAVIKHQIKQLMDVVETCNTYIFFRAVLQEIRCRGLLAVP
jgi:hypothetical protein